MKLGHFLFPGRASDPGMLFFSGRLRTSFQLPVAVEVAVWFFPPRSKPEQSDLPPCNLWSRGFGFPLAAGFVMLRRNDRETKTCPRRSVA